MNNHFHDTVDNEAHIEFNCRNSEDDEEEMLSFEFSTEAGYFTAENDKNLEPLCTDQNSDEGAAKDVTEVSSAVCEIMKSLSEENSDYKMCTIKLSEEQTVSINTEIRSESNESFEKRSDILNASSNETEIDSDEGSVMNATGCSFEMLESGGSNAIMNNKQYFTKADEMFAICRPQEASKQVNEQRETDIDLTHAEAVEWTSTVKTFFRENRTELRSVNEDEVISSSDSSTSVQKVTDCEEDDDTVNGHIKASEENTSNVCMDRVNEQLCSNETDGKNKQQVSDLSVPIHDTLKTQYYAMGDGDFCKQNKYITADQIIMRFSVPDNIHEKKHNKKNELSKHKATQLKHKNDGKDKKIVSNDICGILLPSLLRTTESRKLFKSPTAISENEFEGKNQTFTVFVAQDDESNISEIKTVGKEDIDFLKELPYKSINQDLERKKCKKRKKNSEVHSSIIDIKGSSKHANKSENFVAFTDLPVDAESGPVISTDNSTPIVIQKEYNGVKVTIEDTTGKIFNNETLFQNISKVLYATTTDSKFIDETKYFTSFKKDSKNGVANTEAGIKGRPVEKSVFSIKPALFYNCEESQDIEHNSHTKNYVQANASGKKIKVEKLRNELKGESDFTIQHTPEEFTSLKQTGALQNNKNNVEIIKDVRKDLPHKLTSSKNLSKKATRNHLSPATATLFEAPTIAVKRRNQIHAKKNFELSQTLEDDYSRCISVPDDMPKNHLNSASEPLSLHRTPPLKVSKNSLQMLNDEENVNTKFYTDGQMVFIDKESFINATLSGRDYNWKNYESPPDFYADSSVSQSSSEFLSEGFPALQVEKDQKSKEISNRLNKLDPVNQVGNSKLSDYQSSSDNNGDEKSQNFVYPLIELHSSNHTYLVDENRNSSQSSSTEQEVDMKSFTTAGMEIWKNANFPDQEHIFHDQEPLTGSGHVKQYQNNSTHSSSITDTEDKFFNDNIKHEISKIFSNSVETQTSKERLINISAGTGYGKKQLENQFTCYEPTAKEHNMSFNQNTENSDTMMQHFSIVKDYIKSSTENLNGEKEKLEKNLSSETVSDSGYQLQMTDTKFTYSRLNDKDSSTSISKATDIPLISVSSISEPDAELKLALPSHKSNSVSSLQQIHVVLQIGGEETLEKQYFPSPKKLESIVKDTASPTCTSEEKEIADIPVMKGKQKISLKGSFTGHKQKCDKLRKHGSDKSVRQITGITNEELTASSEKIKKGKNKVSMFFSKLINSKSNSEIDPILKSNYSNIGEEDRVLIVGYEENQDEEKQVKFLERGAKKSPEEMKWLKSMENTSTVRNMSQESQSLEKIKGTELKKNVRKHNFEIEGKVQSTKIWNYLTPVELLMYFRRGFRKDQMTLNKKACFIERADRIDTAAIENENVIDITGRCLPLNFLSKLGYSVEEAAIILQDEEHKARLNAAIQEAKIWVNSVTKSQGALLYLLSCNAKPKIMRHFLYVVEAIVNRRIINAVKLNGVIKVLEQLEDKEISLVEIFGSELVPDTEAVEKQKLQELYKNLYSMTENEAISAGKYPLSERTVYLVKYLAAKFHPKLEQHSAILTQYIGQGLITKLIQIEAAMLYLRALEDETVNIAEFEEYCEIRR